MLKLFMLCYNFFIYHTLSVYLKTWVKVQIHLKKFVHHQQKVNNCYCDCSLGCI